MVFVKVKDMAIGKTYLVKGVSKKLTGKDLTGNGGNQGMDPDYKLVFEDGSTIVIVWDEQFEEVPGGGKRKSRLNRKTRRKSRKNRRKSNNRRRH
jgi:hypothetical protein